MNRLVKYCGQHGARASSLCDSCHEAARANGMTFAAYASQLNVFGIQGRDPRLEMRALIANLQALGFKSRHYEAITAGIVSGAITLDSDGIRPGRNFDEVYPKSERAQ